MSVSSPKNSVFDYLKLIRDKAVLINDNEIKSWCDKVAEIIDVKIVDGKVCRREKINPLE